MKVNLPVTAETVQALVIANTAAHAAIVALFAAANADNMFAKQIALTEAQPALIEYKKAGDLLQCIYDKHAHAQASRTRNQSQDTTSMAVLDAKWEPADE